MMRRGIRMTEAKWPGDGVTQTRIINRRGIGDRPYLRVDNDTGGMSRALNAIDGGGQYDVLMTVFS
jgi:hypothetical protein